MPKFRRCRRIALAATFACVSNAGAGAPTDYPTEAVADYVFACIKANGETSEALRACSCSIDVVASILPYDRYEEASAFLSLMQIQGEAADLFRSSAESKSVIQDLRRAQAEGEIRCFKGG